MNPDFPAMRVRNVIYTKEEVLKMIYYFQNKGLIRIIWTWIALKFDSKVVIKEDVLTYE